MENLSPGNLALITSSPVLAAARDAIIIIDQYGIVSFWNRAAEQLFGYPQSEIIGRPLSVLPLPDTLYNEPYWKHFQSTDSNIASGERIELRAKHKNGGTLDIELSISALQSNGAWYTVGIIHDISKRKQAQQELEKSRRQYLELTENAPIGIIGSDANGMITFINQRALEILGSTSIEETKKINLLRFPLLVTQGFSKQLETCMQNNKDTTFEMNYISKWEKESFMRIHIKPLTDKDAVTGAQIIIDDITAKKQLEEERKLKEERLTIMLKGIPNPAWLISRERRILAQNAAAAKLFKAKVGDSCNEGLFDTDLFNTNRDIPFSLQKSVSNEVNLSGTIWETWCIPLGEDIYIYYALDITRFKKIEEELLFLSVTDTLTGVYNRRYFLKKLETEIERANRTKSRFSLIMLDLDHFKEINDKFGHNTGDIVLRMHSNEVIQSRLRKIDTIARWGGEEFIILLPETSVDHAAALAEDLRKRMSKAAIPGVGIVTASFGVASYCFGDTADDIIQRADRLMYEAKAAGRNCVRSSGEC